MRRGLVAVAALLLLAACGSDAPAAEPNKTSSTQVPDSAAEAEAAAIDAYNNFWVAVAEAGAIPDADHTALTHYASGDALDKVKRMILGYEAVGHYTEGQVVTNPQITESTPPEAPTEVAITDCMDTRDSLVYDRDTGEPANDVTGGFREIQAIVELIDEEWLVIAFGAGKVGSCEGSTT